MCAHMCLFSKKLHPASLRHTKQSLPLPAGRRLCRGFRFPLGANDSVAATHTALTPKAITDVTAWCWSQHFWIFWIPCLLKDEIRLRLTTSSLWKAARGRQRRVWCTESKRWWLWVQRNPLQQHRLCCSKVQTGNLHMEILYEGTLINNLNCTLKRLQQLGRGKWALSKQEQL